MKPPHAAALIATAALVAGASPATLSPPDPVDEYIAAEMQARRIPGLALAVVRDGAIVRTSYYGMANVEVEAPVNERSIFAIASLDKELTAAGVMRLVETGRVSLDDPVARYVEGPWRDVRLRHLLTHTSGLPDQVAGSIEGRAYFTYTTEQLVATVRDLASVAPPGERFLYSDANFFLSQLVTERAAGEPWRTYIAREIFDPAGMRGATFLDAEAIRPGRVSAYTLDAAGTLLRNPSRDIDYGPLYNDLGMTVRDFASWLQALDTDRPLSLQSRRTMWTPVRLSDGEPAATVGQWRHYGFGFGLDEVFGHAVVTHSGYVGVGFVKFPEQRLSVIVFTNLRHGAGSDPIGLAYGVAGFSLPDVGFLTRKAIADPSPARTASLRAEYERLLDRSPSRDAWTRRRWESAWEGAEDLAARRPRLGRLTGFEVLGSEQARGEQWTFRAQHEHGRIFLRVAFDAGGRIDDLQWYHV